MSEIQELASVEIDQVAGGMARSVSGYIDGAASLAGGGAMGYAAAIGTGVGLSALGVGALAVGAAALVGYGIYRVARA